MSSWRTCLKRKSLLLQGSNVTHYEYVDGCHPSPTPPWMVRSRNVCSIHMDMVLLRTKFILVKAFHLKQIPYHDALINRQPIIESRCTFHVERMALYSITNHMRTVKFLCLHVHVFKPLVKLEGIKLLPNTYHRVIQNYAHLGPNIIISLSMAGPQPNVCVNPGAS